MDQQFVLKFVIDIGLMFNDKNVNYSVRYSCLSPCGKYLSAVVYTADSQTNIVHAPIIVLFRIEEERLVSLKYLLIKHETEDYFLTINGVCFNNDTSEVIVAATDIFEKKRWIYIYEFDGTAAHRIKQKIDVTENETITVDNYYQYLFLTDTKYTNIIGIIKKSSLFGYIQKEEDQWVFKRDFDQLIETIIDSECSYFWSEEKNLCIRYDHHTPKIEIGENFNPDTKTFDLIQTITPEFPDDRTYTFTKHFPNRYGILLTSDFSTMVVIYPRANDHLGSASILKYYSKTKHYIEEQVINNPFNRLPNHSVEKYLFASAATMNPDQSVLVLSCHDKQLIIYTKK